MTSTDHSTRVILARLSPDDPTTVEVKASDRDGDWSPLTAESAAQLELKLPSRPTLLLDDTLCSYLSVSVPRKQHNQLQKVLPYLCEDFVCDDVEQMHFAIGSVAGERVHVTAIAKSTLSTIVSALKQAEVFPSHLTTCAELLRNLTDENESLLWIQSQCCYLAQGGCITALAATDSRKLLDNLDTDGASSLQIYHHCANDPELKLAITAWQARSVDTTLTPIASEDSVVTALQRQQRLMPALRSAANLLQGPYALTPSNPQQNRWQHWAWSAAAVAALHLCYLLVSGFYFSQQAEHHHQASLSLYQDYFPNDRRIINIRTQTLGHLQNTSHASSNELRGLLQQLAAGWSQLDTPPELESLRYDGQKGQLMLDLRADSIEQLNKLRLALGTQAKLLSANGQNDATRGRLALTGGLPR